MISFVRKVRKNNPDNVTITALDNLNSHKVEDVKVEAKRLGTGLVFLPPYCPPH